MSLKMERGGYRRVYKGLIQLNLEWTQFNLTNMYMYVFTINCSVIVGYAMPLS